METPLSIRRGSAGRNAGGAFAATLLALCVWSTPTDAAVVTYANSVQFPAGSAVATPGWANRADNWMFTNSVIPPNRPVGIEFLNTIGAIIAGTKFTSPPQNNIYQSFSPAIYAKARCFPPSPYSHVATCKTNTL